MTEFFGNFILVNGMTWPKMHVEPRKYRFRLLNGSDSRFYIFSLDDGSHFIQVGSDNGLLPAALDMSSIILGPGERADVVIDFSGKPTGTEIIMLNYGPDGPYTGNSVQDGTTDPATTGQIMKFIVDQPPTQPQAGVEPGTPLNDIAELNQNGATVRQLALFEGIR